MVLAGVATLIGLSATGLLGPRKKAEAPATELAPQIELPGGGTTILPNRRVVAFFGVPGGGADLGILGVGSPSAAAEKLREQAYPYDTIERPLLGAFELIATIAHDFPGERGVYNGRLSDAQIEEYLRVARQEGFILILDIQPGHAKWMDEVRHYRKWLEEPDVSLALDPEWSVPKNQVPGKSVIGSITPEAINEVSAYLQSIVATKKLPQKLLIVHQFKDFQVKNTQAIAQRSGVALVINVDGVGPVDQKIGTYESVSGKYADETIARGFKVFYKDDVDKGGEIMAPEDVLDLEPQPDVITYE